MAGICSKHCPTIKAPNCAACNTDVAKFFKDRGVDLEELKKKAKEAGSVTCSANDCTFEYYRTTDRCPLCGVKYENPPQLRE